LRKTICSSVAHRYVSRSGLPALMSLLQQFYATQKMPSSHLLIINSGIAFIWLCKRIMY